MDKRALVLTLDAHRRIRDAKKGAGVALSDVKRAVNAEIRALKESVTPKDEILAATLEQVKAALSDPAIIVQFKGDPGTSPEPKHGTNGHGIASAKIGARGHLILVRDDGKELDAGKLPEGKRSNEQSLIRLRQKVPDTIIQAGSQLVPVRLEAANYIVQTTDNVILVNAAGGNVTITLPAAGAIFTTGQSQIFSVKKVNTTGGDVIVTTADGLIENDASVILVGDQLPAICVISDGTNYWIAE